MDDLGRSLGFLLNGLLLAAASGWLIAAVLGGLILGGVL
jgi:hypothetical protein